MHQVYSVMARAGSEKWILDSDASAHMTGIKSLLKGYKEVATTTVTVANGDILPAKGVGNISFKTKHGYVTFTGRTGSKSHFGTSTYLNANAEGQVCDLWKTGTRNE